MDFSIKQGKKSVSLDGVDGSGKTTQYDLMKINLPSNVKLLDPLGKIKKYWPRIKDEESWFKWWFDPRSTKIKDVRRVLVSTTYARDERKKEKTLSIYERGRIMVFASLAANLSIRSGLEIEDAIDQEHTSLDKLGFFNNQEEMSMVFPLLNHEPVSRVDSMIKEDSERNRFYAEYQKRLRLALEKIVKDQILRVNISEINRGSALEINNRARKIVNNNFTVFKLDELLSDVRCIIGITGLSESGKSSFGKYLQDAGVCRIKVKNFMRGRDIAVGSHQLMQFFDDNQHYQFFSIESLHGSDLNLYLKLLFGEKFKIVNVKARESIRLSRHLEAGGTRRYFRQKEFDKRRKGKIGTMSDFTIDTSDCSDIVEAVNKNSQLTAFLSQLSST